MLFALLCNDKPESGALRAANREDHLAHLAKLGDSVKFAGPFLGDDGKPNGSLVMIEAEDEAAARAIADADPYAKAGVFSSVTIRPWKWTVKNPDAA
ncbi:YciI-like protein [Consotaella aegiceratis]|uniref:YciI-like protein n=1 Tax=Consotaella aegiceratis TaxID=3097961 RepID=UPI002F422566